MALSCFGFRRHLMYLFKTGDRFLTSLSFDPFVMQVEVGFWHCLLTFLKLFDTFHGHDRRWIGRILFNEIEQQADVRFPRKSICYLCDLKYLLIHLNCMWIAESINLWVEKMAMRGDWNRLSRLFCEIVSLVKLVGEKWWNFEKPTTVATMS